MTDFKQILQHTLSNQQMWNVIIATIAITFLGFILAKFKVLKIDWKDALIKVSLNIGVSALALTSFMSTASLQALKEQGMVILISLGYYTILYIIAVLWVKFMPGVVTKLKLVKIMDEESMLKRQTDQLVFWMMLIFGSGALMGVPIIASLFEGEPGPQIAGSVWNLPYRIFLYSFAFVKIGGLKFKGPEAKKSMIKAATNPILLCTIFGMIFWLTTMLPGAASYGAFFTKGTHGWYEFSVTLPFVHKTLKFLGDLAAPISWLAIGISLAAEPLKSIFKDKQAWHFSAHRLITIPIITFAIVYGFNSGHFINKEAGICIMIFVATPPTTVVVAYALQFKKSERLALNSSTLSTILSAFFTPLWIIISYLVFK